MGERKVKIARCVVLRDRALGIVGVRRARETSAASRDQLARSLSR